MGERFSKELNFLVTNIVKSYHKDKTGTSYLKADLPNRDVIIEIIHQLRQLIYPGYFNPQKLTDSNIEYYIGNLLMSIEEKLKKQVRLAILYYNNCEEDECMKNAAIQAEEVCIAFFQTIPKLREYIATDVQAAFDGDPAAADKVQIIFSYPGTYAITIYRLAHELYLLGVPLIPRIMTEYAHNLTGIDINPGATIGKYFFIDHGTGVVVGETTQIEAHVKIYQGVTLGALSTQGGQMLKGVKRHPTIEENVVIYSGATVLGGETIIGKNSIIGGNAFITTSVPAGTRVSVKNPELQFKDSRPKELEQGYIWDWVI